MGGSPDNSASVAAAKKMREETERMVRESQGRTSYQEAARRAAEKRAREMSQSMGSPFSGLEMVQPPQPMQPPVPTQPAQMPQSQSAQVRSAANPMPQGSYGSPQQAKMAALGTGAGAAVSPVNAPRPAMAMSPQLNSFNAPEINNLKFGGA